MATVARALASGFRPVAAAVGGIVLGGLLFLLAAIYGLSFVAEFLGVFVVVVKFAGGVYLIWLGIRMLMSKAGDFHLSDSVAQPTSGSDFLSGLAITLGNPKVIVFCLAFFPPSWICAHLL